jgi:hypothetical protein
MRRALTYLEWCLDQSSAEKVNGFCSILPVTNVGASDLDHSNNGAEYWSFKECIGW